MMGDDYSYLFTDVLLAPFTKSYLDKKEFFYEYASRYNKIINGNGNKASYNDNKKAFYIAQKELIRLFSSETRWNHLDDILKMIEAFYPLEELVKGCNDKEAGVERYYLKHIFKIAREFITFRDGDISIRYWAKENGEFFSGFNELDKVKIWNDITRTTSIDIFIAAALIQYDVDIDKYGNVPNLISLADMPLKKILERGVAETHIHAKAGISYQTIWDAKVNLFASEKEDGKDAQDILYCAIFRAFCALFLEERENESFVSFLDRKFPRNKIKYLFLKNDIADGLKEEYTEDKYRINNLLKNNNRKNSPLLLNFYKVYVSKGISPDVVLYYKLYMYFKESLQKGNFDFILCKYFFKYIRAKNNFFSDKKQKTGIKGLDYFQEFYNKATDVIPTSEKYYYSVFEEQYRTGHVKYLEIKISPRIIEFCSDRLAAIAESKRKTIEQIYMIIHAYKRYIDKYYSNDKYNIPRLGIIYHFIKKDDADNFSGKTCGIIKNKYIEYFDYSSMREGSIIFLDALNELFKEYPFLTKYIVGIDAASLENATEPWVYAPVFSHARNKNNTVVYWDDKESKIQNIGFTYHVGEDFRHIVSGLRHIDEVLDNYSYHTGDRLGHAIALGIDIDLWMNKCEMVAIPIMEYLDNLLWMWSYSKQNDTSIITDKLEYRIMETAERIYKRKMQGINVYTLWRVYRRKFKSYHNNCDNVEKDNCVIIEKNIEIWNEDKLLATHFCPCYYEKYKMPIVVSTRENEGLYKELQNMLIKKVEKMGVYVETNPSSNTAISDMSGIFCHPIIRLNNRGLNIPKEKETCVLSTINSDDPVVFSTNVENEIAYIYYALLDKGCKREEALEWIDKIRKHGIDSTFIKDRTYCLKEDFEKLRNIVNKISL